MREKELSTQHPTLNLQRSMQGNRQFQSSILSATAKNLYFVGAEQGVKVMCISRARATARRVNTQRVKKASREIFFSSCERLRTRDSLVIQMLVNRRCCGKSPLRDRRLRHIRSRRCIRSSV